MLYYEISAFLLCFGISHLDIPSDERWLLSQIFWKTVVLAKAFPTDSPVVLVGAPVEKCGAEFIL